MTELTDTTTFIDRVETWNSGGNVMLDTVFLKSGKVLIISDEAVCKYNSINEFLGDEGEHNYDEQCVNLLDEGCTAQPVYDDKLIGKPFEFDGVEIVNPFISECGRFVIVDPEEYYGDAYRKSLVKEEKDV